MILLRSHSAADYAALPNIDLPEVGGLNESDQSCLREIGEYLLDIKANMRFGVGLLHSHFAIEDDETLVEEVCMAAEAIVLRPMRDASPNLFATAVQFDETDASPEVLRLIGLEYAPRLALNDVPPIGHADYEVLNHVAGVVRRHEKLRRFGLRLLHYPFKLDGRILLETSDFASRRLICNIATEDEPAAEQSIATVFYWENRPPEEAALAVGQNCMQFCKRAQRCSVDRDGNHRRGPSTHEQSHS